MPVQNDYFDCNVLHRIDSAEAGNNAAAGDDGLDLFEMINASDFSSVSGQAGGAVLPNENINRD